MSNLIELMKLADVSVGTVTKHSLDFGDVAIAHTAEGVFVIDDLCTHADVSLSEGDLNGCELECWMHGASFDVTTGKALTPPATQPLKTYPVHILGDGENAVIAIEMKA